MFDPVSLGLMGVGTGMSLLSGFIGKDAASNAQAGQLGFLDQALQSSRTAGANAASLFQPYQIYGSGALSFLQNRLLSGNERQMASVQQQNALKAEVDRLATPIDWNSMPILTGEKASERRASLWQQMEMDRKQQLNAAQSRLQSFEREQAALAPFQKEQEIQLKATQGRITNALDLVAQKSNFNVPQSLSQLRNDLVNDPIFKFRQETGERAINRAAAARGNFMSGAALASIGDFNNQLTADETERYFNRILAGQNMEMQSAVQGLNALTGANQLDVNNLMGLSQLGLNAASGASNAMLQTNNVNATLQGQMAQGTMQTELAKGQAMQQGLQGVGQVAGMGIGLNMMSQFMGANVPKPGGAGTGATPTGGVQQYYAPGGQQMLVNMPGVR